MTELEYSHVSFGYDDATTNLDDVTLEVAPGDVVVTVGASGSGKSTLLRAANGLVPHATGGWFRGDVRLGARSTRESKPRDLADVVGFVHQDPEAQFVVDEVEADIAFVLENLGTDPVAMRRRVEEVLDALAITHLRRRSPATLSGGERQRCAIAGALAAAPSVLVLDEPTSQLDPQGAEDVIGALARVNADLGTTLVIAEHRLERIAPIADRVVVMDGGRLAIDGPPASVLATYPGAPTVARLGRLLGWDPVPFTVRDARRIAAASTAPLAVITARAPVGEPLRTASSVRVELGGRVALRDASLTVHRGEIVALLGRNGAGKTTLLRALGGLIHPKKGRVAGSTVGYVPQDPSLLFTADSVRGELETTLRLLGRRDHEVVEEWLDMLHLTALADRHPRSLSGGERQRVAIAAVGVGRPDVLLLDEPTRGIDAPSRDALVAALDAIAAEGRAVVLATHDVDLAARVATSVTVLGDGEVVAQGDAREVLAGSLFAPAVMRVLPPFLTVEEVAAAIAAAP